MPTEQRDKKCCPSKITSLVLCLTSNKSFEGMLATWIHRWEYQSVGRFTSLIQTEKSQQLFD